MSKRAKYRKPVKPSGTAGDPLKTDHIKATKPELGEALQLLKTRSWPAGHETIQEKAAYKLNQLVARDVALEEEKALLGLPQGMLTDRDVLSILEDLLLKGQITPNAAQAIIQKLVTSQAGQSSAIK